MRSAALLAVAVAGYASAAEVPLIPREILFGNPEKASPQLSPDGTKLAYLAPDKKNVLQVWVRTLGKSDDQLVTADKKRGIRRFQWAYDGKTLLYLQDGDGDENWHVYGVDLATQNVRDFTPFQGVRADLVDVDPKFPDTVLVQLNLRKRELFDVYRLALSTGALTLDTQNPGDVDAWQADAAMTVRLAQVPTPEGGTELRVRDSAKSPWRTWLKAGQEDNLDVVDFSLDGKSVYLLSSLGQDTARLVLRNVKTGVEKIVAEDKQVDAGQLLEHPEKHLVQAVGFAYGRNRWTVTDPSVKADFDGLAKLSGGDFAVTGRDRADKTWIVAFTEDTGPTKWFSWDRAAKKGTLLFSAQPKLEGLALAQMRPVVIPARDGLELPGYLTLPPSGAGKNLPMVLFPHGGPWARDVWGFNPFAQWMANRGYAVLQINFRGSTGFGKKFLHAGDRQWGLKMHDDLIDGVNWAVKQGVADPKRVAIFGGSYGGYSALAGAVYTPEVFRCAVDLFGPSNLATLIHTIPPYWKPIRSMFDSRMGNIDDPKDADLIHAASPLFFADRIRIPMLIGQGMNDPRVKPAESEQIVAAIEKNGGKGTYVTYSDEGHGFARPENRIDFNARAEAFLAENLGGRAEPMQGDRIPGSTAQVKTIGKAATTAAAR